MGYIRVEPTPGQSCLEHMDSSLPHPPTHQDIARHARQLWQDRGCPEGKDVELWLEAERQLNHGGKEAFTERAKAETAAESMVEYQISPAVPEKEAIKAALQKNPAKNVDPSRQRRKESSPPAPGNAVKTGPYSA
jgi:hypothetical protein